MNTREEIEQIFENNFVFDNFGELEKWNEKKAIDQLLALIEREKKRTIKIILEELKKGKVRSQIWKDSLIIKSSGNLTN